MCLMGEALAQSLGLNNASSMGSHADLTLKAATAELV